MCFLPDLLRNFRYVHIKFYDISGRFFSILSVVSISKNVFSLLDGFSYFLKKNFPSNNITEKWCEIDKSVNFLFHSQTQTRMNQRMRMKYRRWEENLENHVHALFTSVVNENLKTWRTRVLQDLQGWHAAAKNMLSFVAPHTSLTTREPGDRNPPLRLWKTALGYWAAGFMKLSLFSCLWCLSALQPIAKCQLLTAFLPRILYIFTLDGLVSVLSQKQISWEKWILHSSTCIPPSILQEL